jgi:histone H3/H4
MWTDHLKYHTKCIVAYLPHQMNYLPTIPVQTRFQREAMDALWTSKLVSSAIMVLTNQIESLLTTVMA